MSGNGLGEPDMGKEKSVMSNYRVHLIPHFHYDVVYCDTYEGYLKISLDNLIEMCNLMDKHPEYKFLIEQVILLREFWERFPEHRAGLRELAAQGRIEVAPGMFVMPDMNLINGESLIRQVETGGRWLEEKLGFSPHTCWIADCWGHHAQLPQVLKKCGYKYYAFSRAMRPDLTDKSEFFWQGLDGTAMLTHWMPAGYNAIVFHGWTYLPPDEENPHLKLEGISAEEYDLDKLSRVLGKLSRYATGEIMLLGNGSDFARPQASAPNLIKEWNKRHPDKKITFALPGEVFRAWEEEGKNIPSISADLNPLFQGTYCTRIDLKQQNRFLENYIEIAEKLSACILKADKRVACRVEEATELMLYNQFHDIICGSLIDEAYQDSLGKYEQAKKLVKEAINLSMDEFMEIEKDGNLDLLIFNSMAKKRTDVVVASLSFHQDGVKGVKITDGEGREIPVQILRSKSSLRNGIPQNTEFSFILLGEAPPLGYKCYRVELSTQEREPYHTSLKAQGRVIENRFYRLEIADSGTIKSLVHKESGQEFVDPERPYFNDLLFQVDQGDFWEYYQAPVDGERRSIRPYPDPYPLTRGERIPYKIKAKEKVFAHQNPHRVEIVEAGPVRLTVKVEGKIDFWATTWEYVQYIYLYDQLERIDFRTEFIPAGRQYRLRVCFPTSIKQGKIRYEIPFGIENRPEGEYPALNWMDYQDDTKGICILNRGIPGNNVTDGVMMLSLFRAVDMGPGKRECPDSYAAGKRQVFAYSLVPFLMEDKRYHPSLLGREFNQPLNSRIGKLKESLNPEKSFFALRPDNVVLSCVKKWGEGIMLRFYEAEGVKASFALELPAHFTQVYETDCLGKDGLQVELSHNRIEGIINPFEIKTFVLR